MAAKIRAKARGRQFDLKLEDVVIPERCPALGLPLYVQGGKRTDFSPTLDRIDSRKGYTKDNVRVISWRANRVKYDASAEELIMIGQWLIREQCGT